MSTALKMSRLTFASAVVACIFASGSHFAVASGASVNSAAETVRTASIRGKFESAPNLAAFIHDSLQRPTEGGRFYASLAYQQCSDVESVNIALAGTGKSSAELKNRSVRFLTELKNRCAGVKQQYPNEIEFQRVLKADNARGAPDTLLIEQSSLIKKGEGAANLARAKRSADPYLLALAIETSADEFAEKIDAKAYANGQNKPTLYMAASAAACEVIGNCKNHIRTHTVCVVADKCTFSDYRDFLRSELPADQVDLFDRTRSALLKNAGR